MTWFHKIMQHVIQKLGESGGQKTPPFSLPQEGESGYYSVGAMAIQVTNHGEWSYHPAHVNPYFHSCTHSNQNQLTSIHNSSTSTPLEMNEHCANQLGGKTISFCLRRLPFNEQNRKKLPSEKSSLLVGSTFPALLEHFVAITIDDLDVHTLKTSYPTHETCAIYLIPCTEFKFGFNLHL